MGDASEGDGEVRCGLVSSRDHEADATSRNAEANAQAESERAPLAAQNDSRAGGVVALAMCKSHLRLASSDDWFTGNHARAARSPPQSVFCARPTRGGGGGFSARYSTDLR